MYAYLAGPMTGIPSFNFPAFRAAAEDLRSQGWDIFNPAEEDCRIIGEQRWADYLAAIDASITGDIDDLAGWGFSMTAAMSQDLGFISTEAEAVICLPGWERSTGARAEVFVGTMCGLPVLLYSPGGLTEIQPVLKLEAMA